MGYRTTNYPYLASSLSPFLPSALAGPSAPMQRDSSKRQAIRVRLFLDAVACMKSEGSRRMRALRVLITARRNDHTRLEQQS